MNHSGPRRLLVSVLLILLIALGASLTPRALAQAAPAEISSHVRGAVLTGSTVTFQWTSAAAADEYFLYAGTTQGGNELFGASQGLRLSVTVGGLPTDGSPVFVRIWTRTGADWAFSDSFFATAGGASEVPAEITSPTFASTLPGDSVTFEWSAGSGVDQYFLEVGTTQGGNELFGASPGLSRSVTVPGLPTDGSIVWVRIWSLFGGAWQFRDAAYTSAGQAFVQADLTSAGFAPAGTARYGAVTAATRSAAVDQIVVASWIPSVSNGVFDDAAPLLHLVATGQVTATELANYRAAVETLTQSATSLHIFEWRLPDGRTISTLGAFDASDSLLFEPVSALLPSGTKLPAGTITVVGTIPPVQPDGAVALRTASAAGVNWSGGGSVQHSLGDVGGSISPNGVEWSKSVQFFLNSDGTINRASQVETISFVTMLLWEE